MLAIILEGAYARYAAGAYGEVYREAGFLLLTHPPGRSLAAC
jgi:hypothetical protein